MDTRVEPFSSNKSDPKLKGTGGKQTLELPCDSVHQKDFLTVLMTPPFSNKISLGVKF